MVTIRGLNCIVFNLALFKLKFAEIGENVNISEKNMVFLLIKFILIKNNNRLNEFQINIRDIYWGIDQDSNPGPFITNQTC